MKTTVILLVFILISLIILVRCDDDDDEYDLGDDEVQSNMKCLGKNIIEINIQLNVYYY